MPATCPANLMLVVCNLQCSVIETVTIVAQLLISDTPVPISERRKRFQSGIAFLSVGVFHCARRHWGAVVDDLKQISIAPRT
jgi:hypothetical protein